MQQEPRERIVGWGFDLARENRPGVPKQRDPARPIGTPHWQEPSTQGGASASLVSPMRAMTPIHATAVPPRGVSGVLRRAAYRVPDYRPRHWLILMLADRVDAIEHGARRRIVLLGMGALVGGWLALARRRRRRA